MFLFNDGLSLMINFNFNEKLGLVENCCYFSTYWILKNDLTSSYQSFSAKRHQNCFLKKGITKIAQNHQTYSIKKDFIIILSLEIMINYHKSYYS